MKMMKMKKVTVYDYSMYNSETCRTGGNYGFWGTYHNLGNGKWEVEYGTTADFDYCPHCGSFNCCCDGIPEIVELKDVIGIIKLAKEKDSDDIWVEYTH